MRSSTCKLPAQVLERYLRGRSCMKLELTRIRTIQIMLLPGGFSFLDHVCRNLIST